MNKFFLSSEPKGIFLFSFLLPFVFNIVVMSSGSWIPEGASMASIPIGLIFSYLMVFIWMWLVVMVYVSYKVSKTINIAEKQEDVKLVNNLNEVFLIFMFAIGIWVLQPRVNRLYEKLD